MLNGDGKATFYEFRLLGDIVAEHRKAIMIWSGTGVIMCSGFPGRKGMGILQRLNTEIHTH
jgi:hypothetical protein